MASQGRRPRGLLSSPEGRFAIGATAALLLATYSLGAMPARAAQSAIPKAPPASLHRLVVPPPELAAGPATHTVPATPLVGAPTRVNSAQLERVGGKSFPALTPPATGASRTFGPAAAVSACSAGSLAASSSSVVEGATVSVTASATCPSGTSVSYAYWLISPGGHAQNMTPWTGSTWTWDTAGYTPGAYQIEVWITDGSTSAGPQTTGVAAVTVSALGACSAGSLAASSSSVLEGATVSVTASATCPSGTTVSYAYWLISPGGHAQNMTPWTGSTWTWDTAGYTPGAYQIEVWITDGSTSAGPQTTGVAAVTVSALGACSAGSLAASSSSVLEGATVGVTASATCPSGTTASYAYWLISPGGHAQNMTPWTGSTWTWDTAGYTPGAYQIEVWITDGSTSAGPQTTGVAAITVLNIALASTQNWSGYVLGDGPFTGAQGTFDIPEIYTTSTNTDTSEWVGVDGWNDSSLIQAGIDEPYNASTNTYRILAWWEILPAHPTEVLISTSTLSPEPGDSITVTLGEVSSGTWGIEVTDNTNGQSFVTDQPYSAPQSSAEWIVEAPTLDGSIETLGDYAPDVTFTNLGTSGPEAILYDVAMFQSSLQVSTPSILDSTGFNVAYGDLAPPPP